MKRLTILLVAMAAAFALHAQGVTDTVKNKASRDAGTVLSFISSEGRYDWTDSGNWYAGLNPVNRIPLSNDEVIITGKCNFPVFWSTIDGEQIEEPVSITIEDGAQVHIPQGMEVWATVKKSIEPYELHVDDGVVPNGWYLISIPVRPQGGTYQAAQNQPDDPSAGSYCSYEEAGFFRSGDYDFYIYDQDEKLYDQDQDGNPDPTGEGEWRNRKAYFNEGVEYYFVADYNGYLYANSKTTTLSFYGPLYNKGTYSEDYPYGQKIYSNLYYNADADDGAKGVNLIGNPYACNALVQGENIESFYKMNDDRNDVVVIDPNNDMVIAPMTALFAVVNEQNENTSVTFSPIDFSNTQANIRGNGVEGLKIELTANGVLQDRVYMKAGEGVNARKFSMSKLAPKIYVTENGKKYAIAYKEDANVMPLCFTTAKDDLFTLNFDTKGFNGSYLHLIDNATGADIDLLSTPSYTFNSKDCGYASRFKIVFNEEATNEIDDNFAFISNGELVINGTGTVQIFDIVGRNLYTQELQTLNSQLSTLNSQLKKGVYVVRLCNGNDVKTQKIVVR